MRATLLFSFGLLFFVNVTASDNEPFHKAWSMSYQYNRVNLTNAAAQYGGNGFYGQSVEWRRSNTSFNCSNLAFNIEEISRNYHVVAKTSFLGFSGPAADSAGYTGKQREKILMKVAGGFNIGNLGVQFGGSFFAGEKIMYNHADEPKVNYGGYFYATNTNYGVQYWDRMNYRELGLLVQLVYQFNDYTGIRASVQAGWLNNSRRNVKGTSTEREIKFYHTFSETRNFGITLSYRYSQHLINGMNTDKYLKGNSGDRRFPSAIWQQQTFQVGLNIPIEFD